MEGRTGTGKQYSLNKRIETFTIVAIFATVALFIFNQVQISAISSAVDASGGSAAAKQAGYGEVKAVELAGADVSKVSSTAMAVSMVFPELAQVQDENDAIAIMISAGAPEYSDVMGGISFDEPVMSMEYLAKWYPALKQEIQQNEPDMWERYLQLAAAPRGISCEFCCGLGAQAIDETGRMMCGCKHAPALHALTLGLMKYTDYTDAEVLREALLWKTMFFPKNMVAMAMQVAGSDPAQLQNLPGMVGGC